MAAQEIPLNIRHDDDGRARYVGVDGSAVYVIYADEAEPRLVVRPKRRRRTQVEDVPNVEDMKDIFLEEIRRAEDNFEGTGYVGFGYFLTHWKGPRLPFGIANRKPVVEALIADGLVELYVAHDGKEAIRSV